MLAFDLETIYTYEFENCENDFQELEQDFRDLELENDSYQFFEKRRRDIEVTRKLRLKGTYL